MRIYQGIPVSPGVAIGPALVQLSADSAPVQRAISHGEVDTELDRFHKAVEGAREELQALASGSSLTEAIRGIASSHREFLADPTLHREVEDAIRNGPSSAEWAVASVFRRWIQKFKSLEDEFFRQRYVDLIDLERRLLRKLLPKQGVASSPDHPVVLVTQDPTPSEVVSVDRKQVMGFVTEMGGPTSHTAIVAKSMGIPAVFGLGQIMSAILPGGTLICDGESGQLIVDPDAATLERYKEKREHVKRRFRILKRMAQLPSETPDGWKVSVLGNIEFPFEVDEAIQNGAAGIGLYRTEFLYTEQGRFPDEESHLAEYRSALEKMRGRPLVIRTFDFGADKFAAELGMPPEPNPFLGCRSIRYSFARPELFRTQLRAILRASAEGRVKLMLPMISSVTEYRRAWTILEQVKEELRRDRVHFDPDLPVGVMIEIPAAAITADLLAKEADFFSIGTNDLTQYTLAVDRTNERVASLYRPSNPSILRLLKQIIREGERHRVHVSMCGEMACERPYTLLLLGLGIREFSVTPSAVPEVKRVVRAVTRRTAARIARQAMTFPTPEEVDAFLAEETSRLLPET
ncbi:MAG: phosphoenolpyruvate--protein phosphotransferase [Planctomycetota bacterium]